MLDMILDQRPALKGLEETVLDLERDRANAMAKAANLTHRVMQTRQEDLEREAQALNNGRKVPPPKAPAMQEALADVEHEIVVLNRRLELATAERNEWVSDNYQDVFSLLKEHRDVEAERLARSANDALTHLLAIFRAEDEARSLVRAHQPPPEINTSDAAAMTVIDLSAPATHTPTGLSPAGGPMRGELESVLRHLQTFAVEETTVVGSEADGAA
jgi:hypothetical protein